MNFPRPSHLFSSDQLLAEKTRETQARNHCLPLKIPTFHHKSYRTITNWL